MNAIIKNKYWWFVIILFIGHQILQKVMGIAIPILDNQLDPFLCMPLLLSLWQLERHYLWKLPIRLSIAEIVSATLLLMFLFEYFFPLWHAGFTADYYDLIAYSLGSLFFFFFINPPEFPNFSK